MNSALYDPSNTCIYCGRPVISEGEGEHIVPQALGGTRTFNRVCQDCNNGVLSQLDEELVTKSPLRVIAVDYLPDKKKDVWDYSAELDVVTEAYILPGFRSPMAWPQVVFGLGKPKFVADAAEMTRVGGDNYLSKFLAHALKAAATLGGKGKKKWSWQPICQPPRRGRLTPRVFAHCNFESLNNRTKFYCKGLTPIDQEAVLNEMGNWHPEGAKTKEDVFLGVADPETRVSFEPRKIVRSLTKIGINLLAHIATATPVCKETFAAAISFVRDDEGGEPSRVPQESGFVWQNDVEAFCCPPGNHKFRLMHNPPWWSLDCAFFGGRIGATVAFPGPNNECWQRAEIVMPLGCADWSITKYNIITLRQMRVEWKDIGKIMPSVPFTNLSSEVRLEPKDRPGIEDRD